VRIMEAQVAWRQLLLLFVAWLAVTTPVWAGDQILVVGDTSRSYVRGFVSSLKDSLSQDGTSLLVVEPTSSSVTLVNVNDYRCIVTVGHEAAIYVANTATTTPVLHALVTDTLVDELYKSHPPPSPRLSLLIEQPVSRLLLLANTTMLHKGRVGVLYGPSSVRQREEVRKEARRIGLTLLEKEIHGAAELNNALSFFQGNVNILITLQDAQVVNEGTVKTLILGAYHDNLPLAGYSQALVKAGAMMAVYTTPEQFGRQAAELIKNKFWKELSMPDVQVYPRYFQVSVNYQVARALGVDLPDENKLEKQIQKQELLQ
jgi:putative ABC transport system substrate-binding protein